MAILKSQSPALNFNLAVEGNFLILLHLVRLNLFLFFYLAFDIYKTKSTRHKCNRTGFLTATDLYV